MPTSWTYPTTASQYTDTDVHIPWLHNNETFTEIDLGSKTYEINLIYSAKDLLHISNTLVQDIRMKTYYLVLTGFNWRNLPITISGIEARINVRRTGRITDETIQLYHDAPIGINQATLDLSNDKLYGAPDSLWGSAEITRDMLTEPTFGIVLRYQSHPDWPHKVTPNMEHVQLRVW
jgi:hypothetical protein